MFDPWILAGTFFVLAVIATAFAFRADSRAVKTVVTIAADNKVAITEIKNQLDHLKNTTGAAFRQHDNWTLTEKAFGIRFTNVESRLSEWHGQHNVLVSEIESLKASTKTLVDSFKSLSDASSEASRFYAKRCENIESTLANQMFDTEKLTKSNKLEMEILQQRLKDLEDEGKDQMPLEIVLIDGGKKAKTSTPPRAAKLLKRNAKIVERLTK